MMFSKNISPSKLAKYAELFEVSQDELKTMKVDET